MFSPKNTAFRICSAIWLGVSIVSGNDPVRYSCAPSSSRSPTRSRWIFQISSTISRSVSPVVSDRVLVCATMSPACLSALKSAEAP